MKQIVGYVRDIPGGAGLAGVPVSIRLQKDGTLVPVGGLIQASTNPINTDANGRFEWQCELSPGPIKVEAAIDASAELKVRMGEEVMQAGDIFISDIPSMGAMFTNGVIDDVDGELVVSAVVGALQVSVAAGTMIINGRIFKTHTERTLNIAPNPDIVSRIDVVYVEHVMSGEDIGKQDIKIQQGITTDVVPTIPTVAGVTRIAIARVTIPQGATSVTVVNVAPLASPTNIKLDPDQVLLTNLAPEVEAQLNSAMFLITSPTSGQHLSYNGTKWVNEANTIANADDATITSPVAGQVLTYNAGKWKNLALPAEPTLNLEALSDVDLTSPAANQVLTYSGGIWKNLALPAAPTVSIAAATDSVITAPATGEFLVYSSGKWRNAELTITFPSSKYAEANFSQYGDLSTNVLIASCAVTVPAGTWLLKGEAFGQMYTPSGGGGAVDIWFQGSAVTSSNSRVYFTNGNWRGWYSPVGRVVTVSATTTFTLDMWAAHESGVTTRFGAGKLSLMAV